jgi:hypothetical protein
MIEMAWTRNLVLLGEMRNVYEILVGKPRGKYHSQDVGADESIILIWILGE